MHCQEITKAIMDGDTGAVRSAFRALVDFPHEQMIFGAHPDALSLSLTDCVRYLRDDTAVMPAALCDVLELPRSAPYGIGAEVAAERLQAYVTRYRDHFRESERRAG